MVESGLRPTEAGGQLPLLPHKASTELLEGFTGTSHVTYFQQRYCLKAENRYF